MEWVHEGVHVLYTSAQTAGRLFLFPIVGNNVIKLERSVSLFVERSQKHRKKIWVVDNVFK